MYMYVQVFKGHEYHSLGHLSERVPVISCGALSKRYLVPGLRCGWLVIYDKTGLLNDSVSINQPPIICGVYFIAAFNFYIKFFVTYAHLIARIMYNHDDADIILCTCRFVQVCFRWR